jgi:hypothetical protein
MQFEWFCDIGRNQKYFDNLLAVFTPYWDAI